MSQVPKIKESTRQRCHIVVLDEVMARRLVPISLELFHFLYNIKALPFSIYFRIEDTLIEYIKPEEYSKELLDELWEAVQRPRQRMEICLKKIDRPKFDALIEGVRVAKIKVVRQHIPYADQKTLDLYANISTVSQYIVQGGIDLEVVEKVRAGAAYLVSNAIDSDAAITTLSRMIVCDPTLYDHSAMVAMIAAVICQQLPKTTIATREAELIAQAALYHDVGKTCIPQEILNKPGKLTPDERKVMETHSPLGQVELEKVIKEGAKIDLLVARVAGEHHEKWDGSGYPTGRKGAFEKEPKTGIHFFSRVVTISDIYSALLMKRVYKPAFEPQDAIKIMADEAKGFDPELFLPFLKGVVKSLNAEQKRHKDKGRILVFEENGKLEEWKSNTTKKIG